MFIDVTAISCKITLNERDIDGERQRGQKTEENSIYFVWHQKSIVLHVSLTQNNITADANDW